MKKWVKRVWFSLNGRLMLCLAAALAGMSGSAFLAFHGSWQDVREQAYQEFTVTSSALSEAVAQKLDAAENAARLVGYSTSVQQFLLSDDPETVIRANSPALNHLDTVMQLSPGCSNICLFSYNQRRLFANTSHVREFHSLLKNRGFDKDVRMSAPFFSLLPESGDSARILYCMPIFSTSPPQTANRAIVGVVCDMDDFARYAGRDKSSFGTAALLYADSLVSSSRPLEDWEKDLLPLVRQGQDSLLFQGERYLTTRISLPERYWEILYYVPEREILTQAVRSLSPWLVPLTIAVSVLSLLLVFLIQSVNRSLGQITGGMDRLGRDEDSPTRLPEPPLVELQLIARSANRMLERLRVAFDQERETQARLYQAINAQSKAEFMGYRSQINPHFLFNTLECMRSMAHSRGQEDIETLVSAMALTFRYSLYSGTMTHLSQELSHVRSYFQVVCIRFPGRYSLHISAEPEVLDHVMLSMVLQPIVENAIVHAFDDRETGCRVCIQAFHRPEGALLLRVTDNGVGMDPGELEILDRRMRRGEGEPQTGRSSIGLHNIFQRMKLTFGGHFHIRFRSKKGFYTSVELVIPKSPSLPPFQT